jgi:L-ascorbate metabolism protein UlaG (beta-lactamase superfamily)
MSELAGRGIDLALLPIWGWGPTLGPGHMDPEQAAEAARLLGADVAVPMHYGAYEGGPWYRPPDRPLERFLDACSGGPEARPLAPGEELTVGR